MPRHNFAPLQGELRTIRVTSAALRHNQLGDPSEREVLVYLPAGTDPTQEDLPLFVALAAFTGSGLKLANWRAFDETLPQRLDRLVASGAMGPVALAMPDAFTSLGGNQYLDGPVLGDWSTYLRTDLIDALEAELGRSFAPERRAVFGHSSGGYGALMQGLRHPEAWGAVACHSGDMGFELLYRPDMPKALRALAAYGGEPRAFLDAIANAPKLGGEDFYALMMLAMAASYDPGSDDPFELPVDPHTCELRAERWARWLAHDPVHIAEDPTALEGLRSLRGLYFDCGERDEYNLVYGARRFAAALEAAELPHTFESFDGGHSNVAFRYDRSLPWLYARVMGN